VNAWSVDSLITLYESDTWLASHYLLVQYYLDQFNYWQASAILQSIPSQFSLTDRQTTTHQKYLSLLNLSPQLYCDTAGYIIPDSIQASALLLLAEDDNDFPGAWARNILIASGLLEYQEPIVNESTLKSSRKGKFHWTRSRSIISEFKVFPNPTKDFIIVEYQKASALDQVLIEIIDAKGIEIKSCLLSKTENQPLIPVEGLPTGIYLIRLRVNGSPKDSHRVVIIR